MIRTFRNRTEAGRLLAARLAAYSNRDDVTVLALPRGGVPVAFEVGLALKAPLDVFLVRKLGVPGHEELAMGAIATGSVRVLNADVVRHLHIPPRVIDSVAQAEQRELERRESLYRAGRPPSPLTGRILILVDDGLATGSTMLAAVEAVRRLNPARVIVAVPVAPRSTAREFKDRADDFVCVLSPEPFDGVGRWYDDFRQTSDEEVQDLLKRAVFGHSERSATAVSPNEEKS